jgi:MFS family permease
MGLFSLGPVFGPCLGPIADGFIAESVGWRWTFRVLVILVRASPVIFIVAQSI